LRRQINSSSHADYNGRYRGMSAPAGLTVDNDRNLRVRAIEANVRIF
jgi:hypothetical protein